MTTHIRIEGIVRTLTPLHITAPDSGLRYDPKSRRYIHGGKSGFPCTPTRTQRFFVPSLLSEQNPSGVLEVPILPASTLRGRLRREAAKEIEDHLVYERAERPSWQAYQVTHSGAVTGIPEGGTPDLAETRAALDHVFMGLFGGGTRMLPGGLAVGSGWPLVDALFDVGTIPDRYRDENTIPAAAAWRLIEPVPIVRGDDLLQFRDPRAKEVVRDYNEAMLELLETAAKQKLSRLRGAGEGGESEGLEQEEARGLRAFSYQQIVVPGVPFYVRFDVRGSVAQAGMLIVALRRLLSSGDGIGGRTALGYGRLAHDLTLEIEGERVTPYAGQEEGTRINLDEPVVVELVKAAEAAISEISASELDRFAQAQ